MVQIVVDGDVTIDRNIASAHGQASVSHQLGGAARLAELVARVVQRQGAAVEVLGPCPAGTGPDDLRLPQSWALWSPAAPGGAGWRVERVLGLTAAAEATHRAEAVPAGADVALVVLDDAGLGFRDHPERWPTAIAATDDRPMVVLNTRAPVATGALWDHLFAVHRDRLVVVVQADDLRRSQVQVTRGLSWERTAQDLAWELIHNTDVQSLSRCAHVVVTFGAAGAVIASRPGAEDGPGTFTLVFDPEVMEGEWEHERPGLVPGAAAALTALVVSSLVAGADHEDLCAAVTEGLGVVRRVHDAGYQLTAEGRLAFPLEATDPSGRASEVFACAAVPDPGRFLRSRTVGVPGHAPRHGYWTILEEAYPDTLDEVSRDVVLRGSHAALGGVPHGAFGKLFTVDRHEIEALRAIRGLMEEYCSLAQPERPLSVAVFGPPGSGKSFGVAQMANSLWPGRLQKLEFNLSQLDSPDGLMDALHQVRDASLTGRIPLVFWDEFDTPLDGVPLGWLRYFLAPMQDGAFRQGQLVHPVGRAIFVFAGGTSASMHDFGTDLTEAELRSAKKPDFVSRLRGYLDVLGPNPHPAADEMGGDRFHRLRRAILLDALLRRKAPQLLAWRDGEQTLNIDPGVLRAFLEVPRYVHGARSMEAIIDMSHLAGHQSFERSCLPSESQLGLHVDGRRFLALVQWLDLSGEMLERLASAAHDVFRAGLMERGYRPGAAIDETRKTSPKLGSFAELAEEDKEQNRANVRDIPLKLARVGYVMVAAKSEEANAALPADIVEQLARDEHDRWMAEKLARGWVLGEPTDEAVKRHEALLPWDDLSESQREKDRVFVASIAEIISRCGYAVVPVPA